MKTIKLIIFITGLLLATSINIKDICFSFIPETYASEGLVKEISDIKSVTLIIERVLLSEDMPNCGGSLGSCPHHIWGNVIFKDEDGKECAIDYGGIAELSCAHFHKEFYISPNDFKIERWADSNAYSYPIKFKIMPEELPRLGETVKFKIENFEVSCSFSQGYRCEGTSLRR